MHRIIKFNQKAWLKSKKDFEKKIFKSMKNSAFGKIMENVRKHRDVKLIKTEKRRNYLVSKANYHSTKFFTEMVMAKVMNKTQIFMNKYVYLGLSILELINA